MAIAVGLDIGSEAVRAAAVDTGGATPVLRRFAEMPLPPGAVIAGDIADEGAVTEAVSALWKRHHLPRKRLVVGIANQRVIVRQVDVPHLEEEELVEALPTYPTKAPSRHSFPRELRKYCICAHIFPRYVGAPRIMASAMARSSGLQIGIFSNDLLKPPAPLRIISSSARISGTRISFTSAPSISFAPFITASARRLVCPSKE